MLSLLIMFAAVQTPYRDGGQGLLNSFRGGAVARYQICLRAEETAAGEVWDGPAPGSPTLVEFARLIQFCRQERLQARTMLDGLIRARHPRWATDRVTEAVEFVLSGIELQYIEQSRTDLDRTVHDTPEDRF